ncbi:hypothetical protein [Natrinema sp. SYSU A 869]|uniref:hypothetical protein n=1 Tax=Natrinema sp. SYSU A 869 TaxID=2871694 RepID=UPI001CA43444|nr:hypothetical protein [Natrinema sp. SYSU A 869]
MNNEEIHSVLSFGSIDQMAKENKGAFGESLAGIWLKDQIKKDPSIISDEEVSESHPRTWFSHVGKHRCKYGKVDDDGLEEIAWEPDYSFHVTLPDYDVRKEILIEAKTGNSSLERHQSDVMRLVAQEDEMCVFFCKIDLCSEQAVLSYEEIVPEIEGKLEGDVDDDQTVECYDCGAEIGPNDAHLTDRDGSPFYVCSGGECQ